MGSDRRKSRRAIRCSPDNLDPSLGLQQGPEAAQHDGVIVSQNNTHGLLLRFLRLVETARCPLVRRAVADDHGTASSSLLSVVTRSSREGGWAAVRARTHAFRR